MRQKDCNNLCKICAPHFDEKMCRTYMVCAGCTRIRNCDAFCQTRRNSANVPHFHCKRCTQWEKSGAHMVTCFQVPLRCVCCILFDAYRSHYYLEECLIFSAYSAGYKAAYFIWPHEIRTCVSLFSVFL